MKVVAFNGSPNEKGNTYYAIKTVLEELEKEGIETEIVHIGGKPIRGCIGCEKCRKNKDEKCILPDDGVNECIQKMKGADGILLGSPVYYSSIAGTMKCFLDRTFYVAGGNNRMLRHKVGASVVAVRRCGGMPTFNQLNNYIGYSEMLMPASNYWNVIYGEEPGEVLRDKEGMQIMRVLGKNMAWLMKLVENGKGRVKEPEAEGKLSMNFIR